MSHDISTLFLIPARGGSKGIPGKNIRNFGGKPLICHSIDHARMFACDDDICLSTDSEEIRSIAESYGLHVPFLRPASLATDNAGTYGVLLHALDFYAAAGREYDRIVLLQPTSPLRTRDDISRAIELFRPGTDMVVTVTPAATNPYYNAYETGDDGFLHISKGDGLYTRRQDAPEVWEYNGAVYVIDSEALRRSPMSEFRHRVPSPMSKENSVDLDSELDWMIAETIYNSRR